MAGGYRRKACHLTGATIVPESPTTIDPTKTNTVATLTGVLSVLPTLYPEMSDPHEINATCKAQLLKEFPWVTSVVVDKRRRHTMQGRHTLYGDCSGWIYRVEGTRREADVVTRTAAVMFFKMDATDSAPSPPA